MSMNEVRERKRVGIIGGSQPKPYQLDLAYQVGQLIAKKGGLLVCGGLGGVMEAAARGAKEAGGLTIGVLPGINYQEANPYIDFPLATGLGHARNVLVVLNSDVLIAIGGEYGTLSEIAFGRIYGRKIISLDSWDIPGVIKARTPEEACELAWL